MKKKKKMVHKIWDMIIALADGFLMAHRCLDGVTGEIANRRAKFFFFFFFFYIMGH